MYCPVWFATQPPHNAGPSVYTFRLATFPTVPDFFFLHPTPYHWCYGHVPTGASPVGAVLEPPPHHPPSTGGTGHFTRWCRTSVSLPFGSVSQPHAPTMGCSHPSVPKLPGTPLPQPVLEVPTDSGVGPCTTPAPTPTYHQVGRWLKPPA